MSAPRRLALLDWQKRRCRFAYGVRTAPAQRGTNATLQVLQQRESPAVGAWRGVRKSRPHGLGKVPKPAA
jgi:hypothetical protein